MPNDWDPRTVLEVDPSAIKVNTCVGTTVKGIRCKLSIAWKNGPQEADDLLGRFRSVHYYQTHPATLRRDLERLAGYALCSRWHRNDRQINDVANKWFNIIQNLPARPVARRSSALSTSSTSSTRNRAPASMTSRTSSTPPPSSWGARDRDGGVDIINNVTLYATPSRQDRPVRIRNNVNINLLTPPEHSSRSSRQTSSSSSSSRSSDSSHTLTGFSSRSTSRTLSNFSSPPTPSRSSVSSSRRRPSVPPTITDVDTSDDDTPDTSNGSSSDDSSNDSSNDSSDDGGHRPVRHLLRRIAELEAELVEARQSPSSGTLTPTSTRSTGSTGISTPPTSRSSFSFRRSNAPSRSSNRTDEPTTSESSSHTHVIDGVVQRRPITRDTTCYVCLDPIRSRRESTWCRSSCGNNIHRDCFDEWESVQGAVVKCGVCRSPWTYSE